MKILTICPTYNRQKLLKEMINSWSNTITSNNTLILGVDIGDPSIAEYPKDVNKIICKHKSTVTEIINSIWVQYPDYDFYHITNDDVIYHTLGWDTKLTNILNEKGGGIAYGDDMFQGINLPTFPFISANIVKAVRYLQQSSLIRYCGDTVWHDIGYKCGCLFYLGEVKIEHMHKLAGKGEIDVDMDIFQKDWHSYIKWATTEAKYDVMRVADELLKEK